MSNIEIIEVPLPAPTIATMTPCQIVVGWGLSLPVQLTGSGYTGATTLFVDDQCYAMDARTPTRIQFTLPPHRISTPCTLQVRVESLPPGGGTATTHFTVSNCK